MLNVKYFVALAAITVASCDVYVPKEYWNAKPMSEHPRYQEKLRQLAPNILEPVEKDPFIIGGSPAVRGQFPHFVLMLDIYPNNTAYVCGGSLIHRQWVLTSAFCIDRVAVYFDLYTGIVNITGPASWGTRVHHSDTRVHPQYSENLIRNDIGMIRLAEAPADLLSYPYTGMIELPTETINLVDRFGSISGFGITNENATYASNILNYNSLRVMSNAICGMYYGPGSIFDSNICAETNGTVSTCSSDMGGPFSFVTNGVNRIEGVISFYSTVGCQHGSPVGFTRVSYYLKWIDDTITGRNPEDPWDILRDLQEQYLVTLQNIIEGTNTMHDEN